MTRPVGRPRVSKKLSKAALLSVRVTKDERKLLELAAEKSGVNLSEWARGALLEKASIAKT